MNLSSDIISDALLDEYLHAAAIITAGKKIPPVPDGSAQEAILATFYSREYQLSASAMVDLLGRIQSWTREKFKGEKDQDVATYSILEDVLLARPSRKYM